MNEVITTLLKLYNNEAFLQSDVISWASPVPFFGDISKSRIATLGLNPSNREFVDKNGDELCGINKRFETLNSLKIKHWRGAQNLHLLKIEESCNWYFLNNPYDSWFKKLDYLISGTGHSYYFPYGNACHLDLIPFATTAKWGNLQAQHKKLLQQISMDALGLMLNISEIELLVLNGQSVVDGLAKISNVSLQKKLLPRICLNRNHGKQIEGYGYIGSVSHIGAIRLARPVKILGYNHNIQSSFGISKNIQVALRDWITQKTKTIL